MSFKTPKYFVVVIPKENILKKTIKSLEKENVDLWSNLGRLTREKEDFELNLNQKRAMTSQTVEEAHEEQFKRRKVGDTLKGTIANLFIKKELKEENSRTKKLEVSLSQRYTELDQRFEEI